MARSHTQALVRKLKGIRDPAMRTALAGAFLRDQPGDEVVATLRQMLGEVRQSHEPAAHALADATTAALGQLDYDTRARLYATAKAAGLDQVARLLFDASPGPKRDDVDRILSPERQVVPRGRILTLGERKALARTNRRDLILHVVRDPHPDVVSIFLDNPHVIEADVVAVAAGRGAHPDALAAVAAHPRWRVRRAIRRALVMNPSTPLHLAVRLLVDLRAVDLRAIAADPQLNQELRNQAMALIGGPG